MQRHYLAALALALFWSLAACGGGGGTNPKQDGGPQDTGPQLDAAPQEDATQHQEGGPQPGSSFDTAIALTLGTAKANAINAPSEVDYFKFAGTAGAWMMIYTEAASLTPASKADTVIALYDEAQNLIAHDDDAMPWTSTDSEIIIKLPATGTYYVTVEDWSGWKNQSPAGGPLYNYKLTVSEWATTNPGVDLDTEANDTAGTAQTLTFLPPQAGSTGMGAFILGTFESATDVDVFTFTLPTTDGGVVESNVSFDIMPAGSNNDTDGNAYGSTTPIGEISVMDSTGTTTIAKIDNSITGASPSLSPPLAPGTYQLWVKHPATAAGANDFYVIKMNVFTENPAEVEDASATGVNDTLATAQPLTMETLTSGKGGFILAHLAPNDIDYFSFPVATGDEVSVVCGAARIGSGVTGLTVSLRDSTDTEIANGHAVETATADLQIKATPSAAGTYYVKLSGEQSSTVTSDFVRCGVYAAPPAAP